MAGELVQQVRAHVDIFEIASELTSLKRKGDRFFGRCPLHVEKTPSFSVQPSRGLWYCFGCHRGGDAIELWKLHLGLGFREALHDLARKLGLAGEQDLPPLERWWSWAQQRFSGSPAERYAEERGYSKVIGVGYEPGTVRGLDDYQSTLQAAGLADRGGRSVLRHRLVVPIRTPTGRLDGLCGRDLQGGSGPKDYLFAQGGRPIGLYNVDCARRASTSSVVIAEGVFDQWALERAGALSSVASFGSSLSKHQLKTLAPWDEVVFAYDGDAAGRKGMDQAARRLLSARKRVLSLQMPEGQDPDEVFSSKGPDALAELLVGARDWLELQIEGQAEAQSRRQAARAARELLQLVRDPGALEDYRAFAARHLGLPLRALVAPKGHREAQAPQLPSPGPTAGEIAAVRGMVEHDGGSSPQLPPLAAWKSRLGRVAAQAFMGGQRGREIVDACLEERVDPSALARACCDGGQVDLAERFGQITKRWARTEMTSLSGQMADAEAEGDDEMRSYLREQRATVVDIARQAQQGP